MNKKQIREEKKIRKEISEGLLNEGWMLMFLEKKGSGWVFYIEPIEDEKKKDDDVEEHEEKTNEILSETYEKPSEMQEVQVDH